MNRGRGARPPGIAVRLDNSRLISRCLGFPGLDIVVHGMATNVVANGNRVFRRFGRPRDPQTDASGDQNSRDGKPILPGDQPA